MPNTLRPRAEAAGASAGGSWFGTDFFKVAIAAILSQYRLEFDRRARLDWRFVGITMPRRAGPVRGSGSSRMAQPAAGSIFDFFERSTPA